MNNKNIFATNLKYYMKESGKSRREISDALGVSYYTFSDWVNGKKYPRMDKVEMLADYFGILKSDLIEEKSEEHKEIKTPTINAYWTNENWKYWIKVSIIIFPTFYYFFDSINSK